MTTYLSEISTLGNPEGSSPEAQDQGSGYQGVETGVELCPDVEGVTEHGEDHAPLGAELLEEVARDEHGRDDERRVDH